MSDLIYHTMFEDYPCDLQVAHYVGDPHGDPGFKDYDGKMCMAVQLTDKRDHTPVTTLTVNLGNDIGNGSFMQPFCAFIDTNNNPDAPAFLEETGLAKPYTRFGSPVYGHSGYCSYPLYQFSEEKLKEFDPAGVERYRKDYSVAMGIKQKEMMKEMFGEDYSDEDEWDEGDREW